MAAARSQSARDDRAVAPDDERDGAGRNGHHRNGTAATGHVAPPANGFTANGAAPNAGPNGAPVHGAPPNGGPPNGGPRNGSTGAPPTACATPTRHRPRAGGAPGRPELLWRHGRSDGPVERSRHRGDVDDVDDRGSAPARGRSPAPADERLRRGTAGRGHVSAPRRRAPAAA